MLRPHMPLERALSGSRHFLPSVPASPLALLRSARANGVDASVVASATVIMARAQLGEVDAFLSHSWHDDPTEKWDALNAWAAAFEAKHGRPPLVWFDKACTLMMRIHYRFH